MFSKSRPRSYVLLAAAVPIYFTTNITQAAVIQAVPTLAHADPLVPAAPAVLDPGNHSVRVMGYARLQQERALY